MQKTKDFPYTIEIKIRNDYYMLSCPDFDFTLSPGRVQDVSCHALGQAVVKLLHQILSGEAPKKEKSLDVQKTVAIGDAAKLLQTSISSVRRLIEKGELKSIRTEGGHRRIDMMSLKNMLPFEN